MCGIVGRINLDGKEVYSSQIEKMTSAIVHRGPDDEGIWVEDAVGFGNRRLAVIDLSRLGHMPMFYAKKRFVITYNGEVYNFALEREKLKRKGYSFTSSSDTEVILALYQEYGVKCLEHLRGMFAIAIYDRELKTVFIARDRLGKKPVKYFFDGKRLIFASELKAILTQENIKRQPDWEAIHHYLTFGYVLSPRTGFVGIKKLEPGNYLWLDIKNKTLSNHVYWRPNFVNKLNLPEEEWKRRILKLVEESTEIRMVADVPVGAFLSGGVDSSAVVAMMSKFSDKPIRTFSIGYSDSKYDETEYAKIVSDTFRTEHTTLRVEPESVEILPELARQFEEPFADSSALVTYEVSKLARQYVTVALNGDGGDENFAGYGRYNKQKWYSYLNSVPGITSNHLGDVLNFVSGVSNSKKASKAYWLWKRMAGDGAYRYVSWNAFLLQEDKEVMYKDKAKKLFLDKPSYLEWKKIMAEAGEVSDLDKALYSDITHYLPEDLLTKVDIASMAVSLEARSPLLDHKLVELCASMPGELKVRGFGEHKYIFKKSLEGILPKTILERRKMGFSIPLESWFKEKLNTYAADRLLGRETRIKEMIDQRTIKQMLSAHGIDGVDHGPKLWALLMLELWWREYF